MKADFHLFWPGSDTLQVAVDEEVSANVQPLSSLSLAVAPFVFAWVRAAGDNILAAEAGLPQLRGNLVGNWTISVPGPNILLFLMQLLWTILLPTLVVQVRLMDPGLYFVHFLVVTPSPHANASDPRAFDMQAVRGSPKTLQVAPRKPRRQKFGAFGS